MDAESFTDLALRVLAREATANETRAFQTELNTHPERQEEFAQLKITHDVLRTVAPLSNALESREAELPAHRVNELRTAVRQHFGPAGQRASAPHEQARGFPPSAGCSRVAARPFLPWLLCCSFSPTARLKLASIAPISCAVTTKR